MTIDYTIDESDFLTHQLFVASKSERIKKKRKRNKIIVPIVYTAIGILFFLQNNLSLTIMFFIIGILWFLIYPIWEKQQYIKHYKGFIKENYKNQVGRSITLEFSKDFIIAKNNSSESKISTTELEDINEIPSIIFIRLKGGQSFILPKNKIANINHTKAQLKELANYLQIKYEINEQWEWK
jgi:hypothetical protein